MGPGGPDGVPGPGWGPGPGGPGGGPWPGWGPGGGPWPGWGPSPGFGPGGFFCGFANSACEMISACLSCLCCCWLLGDCFGFGSPRGFEPPPLPPHLPPPY